jgi:hypothetical protein
VPTFGLVADRSPTGRITAMITGTGFGRVGVDPVRLSGLSGPPDGQRGIIRRLERPIG